MTTSIAHAPWLKAPETRRRIVATMLAALLVGCGAQGKLVRRVAYEVPDESREDLAAAVESFAARERFKFYVDAAELDRHFLLTSDDIDISFEPHEVGDMPSSAVVLADEEPAAPAESDAVTPRTSPVRYEAWFFVHTPDGTAPRLESVAFAFNAAIGAVEGVRKIPNEAP